MAVSYKRLWKLLVDKEMSKSDLRKKAEIAPNTMTKLRRDEEVSLTILSKICKTLHADFGDIVEYVPDAEIWDLYNENRELLGKDHVRGEQLPIDGYHLVVHVWIRNSKKAVGGINRMVMDAQYFNKKLEKEAKYQWELSEYLNRDICQPEGFDAYGYPNELFKLDMERLGIATKRKPAKVIDFTRYIDTNRSSNH